MPDSSLLQLADRIGGWVFCAVVITGLLWALFRAIKQGDLVPGSVHNQVVEQNSKLAETTSKLSESVSALTGSVNLLSQRVEDALHDAVRRR